MISRVVLAIVVAVLVGLVCMFLLGPILLTVSVPIVQIAGSFLVNLGWTLGLLAGVWYFFAGATWPLRRV